MAKPTKQKARKEYTCQKSGRTIKPGEYYWKLERAFKPVQIRAEEHPFERSETTSSDYLQFIYNLVDTFCLGAETPEEAESEIEELMGDLENIKEDLEERLENMPEHLRESSNAGQLLQERIEALDECFCSLQGIECENATAEDAVEELYLCGYAYDELPSEQQKEIDEWVEEENNERVKIIEEQVADLLSQLEI